MVMCLDRRPTAIAIALMTLMCAVPAFGQAQQGRIAGIVRDATAIPVAGVTVTATNETTHASQSTTTGTDGSYSFSVAPGGYAVAASLPGFRTATQTVEVTSGATKQADLTLEAALSQEVTVTATKREQAVLDVPF